MRTPLTSILGYVHILEQMDSRDTDEAREYLNIVLDKSEVLEVMLDEFFEVTKLETGNVKLEQEKMNLAEMLQQLVSEYVPILRDKKLMLECDVISQAYVSCDAAKMERVFDNLMRNAMKYAPVESTVHVSGKIEDKYFVICFENASELIESDMLEHIFEPFVRLEESRTEAEGAGIGLAIVKELIELHKGNVHAEYEDGRIRMMAYLPICKPEVQNILQ